MSNASPEIAVIFSSQRTAEHDDAYAVVAEEMEALARQQPGFRGIESARSADGFGITVSYWADAASVAAWKAQADHLVAQERGKADFYTHYTVRLARITRQYRG